MSPLDPNALPVATLRLPLSALIEEPVLKSISPDKRLDFPV